MKLVDNPFLALGAREARHLDVAARLR